MGKVNKYSTSENVLKAKKISQDIQREISKANNILLCMETSLCKLSDDLQICLEGYGEDENSSIKKHK